MGSATLSFLFMVLGLHGNTHSMEVCNNFQRNSINESSTEIVVSSQNIPVLHTRCLENFTKVINLKLKNCRIQEIEEDAFKTMENLKLVDLSNNLLEYLPENLFQHNKLERVLLYNNKFTAVPYVAASLNKLDLSRNAISSLNFTKILKVEDLDLGHNWFVTLSSKDMEILNKIVILNINNNPWKCGSDFDEVLCWSLKKLNIASYKIPIRCTSKMGGNIYYKLDRRQEMCGEAIVELPSYPPVKNVIKEQNTKEILENKNEDIQEETTTKLPISDRENVSWEFFVICSIVTIVATVATIVIMSAILHCIKRNSPQWSLRSNFCRQSDINRNNNHIYEEIREHS